MDSLKEIIVRIARPLEYANKSGTHGLSALKDLGRFVSQQVLTVLGHSVHPPRVEADLLHLVHLFSDYETLGPDLRGEEMHQVEQVRFHAGGMDGVTEDSQDLLGHKPAKILESRKTVRPALVGILKGAGNPYDDLFQAVHCRNVRPFSPSGP